MNTWTTDGNRFSVSMPLQKVNVEERLVSGWATLDNPDRQDDIVLKEASERAFSRFRGNIREMHQPIAVGVLRDWRPDSYYDSETQKFYNGIFTTAYVSKGAQDTWEKVLDGTLSAFSIKGPILDYEFEFSKDAGRPLRIIKDYELEELSLVDSGGNQLANVVSIQKVDGQTVVKGMIVDTKVDNIFYCPTDEVARTSPDDSAICRLCDKAMKNIGFYENDGSDVTEKVHGAIQKFNSAPEVAIKKNNDIIETTEGGDNMSANETVVEETETVEVTEESPVVEVEETEAVKETAAEVEEVEPQNDLVKMISELQKTLEDGLAKSDATVQEKYGELAARVDSIEKSIDTKIAEFSEGFTKADAELTEKFNSLNDVLGGLEKRLDATAVKKSGDLGGSANETVEKSNSGGFWSNAFLGVDNTL